MNKKYLNSNLTESLFYVLFTLVKCIYCYERLAKALNLPFLWSLQAPYLTRFVFTLVILVASNFRWSIINHYSYYYSLWVFHTSINEWSFSGLSDNKPFQVSRTLLNILVNLNNAVIWMVLTLPLISNSLSPCKPLETIPSALIIISITAPSCSIVFLVLWRSPSICLSFFHFFLDLYLFQGLVW